LGGWFLFILELSNVGIKVQNFTLTKGIIHFEHLRCLKQNSGVPRSRRRNAAAIHGSGQRPASEQAYTRDSVYKPALLAA